MVEDHDSLIALIRLHHTRGFGNRSLLSAFSSTKDPREIVADFSHYSTVPLSFTKDEAKRTLERIYREKIAVIPFYHSSYPQLLTKIPDPPAILYAKGNMDFLHYKPALAVVGTRNHSSYGKEVCALLLPEISRRGIPIVSGMALGIDACAHEHALRNNGPTIAVLGSGVAIITPIQNSRLYYQIVEHGCIVSEFPIDFPAAKFTFSQRNRIIAGLSTALLVIEAGEQSGTMITTNYALEQGKDVCVIPGPITSASSQGTNKLLKLGATPITSVQDLLDVFSLTEENSPILVTDPQHKLIIDQLRSGTNSLVDIQINTALSIPELSRTVSELEILGFIQRDGESHIILKR